MGHTLTEATALTVGVWVVIPALPCIHSHPAREGRTT